MTNTVWMSPDFDEPLDCRRGGKRYQYCAECGLNMRLPEEEFRLECPFCKALSTTPVVVCTVSCS